MIYSERNLSMLCDFYELTMSNGYFINGVGNTRVVFDMFYRKNPDNGGFVIAAGLEQVIEYIKGLHFSSADIEYFRSKNFDEKFLDYLANFKFTCDVYAIPEGTPVFPYEPIITVVGPLIQAQLLETMILLTVNHQSLIATKTSRICRAAGNRPVMEFGSRRAQGYDGAIYGARAAAIGGCSSTANMLADELFGFPAVGTMAHSWIQFFPSEYDAFKVYAETYPDNCTLLVDTYDVLKSGIPNAIKVFDEVLKPKGYRPKGVRIDSGDLAYLSKKVRKMLDAAGYPDCKICASNSLDEYLINSLNAQGAKIDSFGIGERLITSSSCPVLGGVYKIVAVEKDDKFVPCIKISENVEKITNPYFKKTYRFYDNETGKAIADFITLYDETFDFENPITIMDPNARWKRKKLENYNVRVLQEKIFENGECIYNSPNLKEIAEYSKAQLETLWDEVKRIENPHTYYVDLSENLLDLKDKLIAEHTIR